MTTEHGAAERRAEMRAIERAEALPYTTIPPSRPWEPFLFAGFVTLVILGVILSRHEGLIWTLLIDAVAIIGLIVYLRYRIRLNKSMPNAAAAPPEIKRAYNKFGLWLTVILLAGIVGVPFAPLPWPWFGLVLVFLAVLSLYRVYDKRWYADAVRDLEARLA